MCVKWWNECSVQKYLYKLKKHKICTTGEGVEHKFKEIYVTQLSGQKVRAERLQIQNVYLAECIFGRKCKYSADTNVNQFWNLYVCIHFYHEMYGWDQKRDTLTSRGEWSSDETHWLKMLPFFGAIGTFVGPCRLCWDQLSVRTALWLPCRLGHRARQLTCQLKCASQIQRARQQITLQIQCKRQNIAKQWYTIW